MNRSETRSTIGLLLRLTYRTNPSLTTVTNVINAEIDEPPFVGNQHMWLLRDTVFQPRKFVANPTSSAQAWVEITRRELTSNDSLSRLVIVSKAGMGKSTTLEYLRWSYCRQSSDKIALLVDVSQLQPTGDKLTQFWHLLLREFRRTFSKCEVSLPPNVARKLLVRLRGAGRLVLLLDHLDRASLHASTALGEIIADGSWDRCQIVLASQHDALDFHWQRLFSDDARAPGWRFVRLDGFTSDQHVDYLKPHTHSHLNEEVRHCLYSPRACKFVRDRFAHSLPIDDLDLLRLAVSPMFALRHAMARRATRILERICSRYVEPTLCEVKETFSLDPSPLSSAVFLTSAELDEVIGGASFRREFRHLLIAAPSGMGKSILLLEAQRRIGTGNEELLPVPLENLNSVPWRMVADVVGRIVGNLSGSITSLTVGDGCPLPGDVLRNHLEQLIKQGRVVFLLDGVETISDLSGFFDFLKQVDQCPVIATLQPHALNWIQFPNSESWKVLKLTEFSKGQQAEILGDELAQRLQSHSAGSSSSSASDGQLLKTILGIPLYLKLFRDRYQTASLGTVAPPNGEWGILEDAVRASVEAKSVNSKFRDPEVYQALQLLAIQHANSQPTLQDSCPFPARNVALKGLGIDNELYEIVATTNIAFFDGRHGATETLRWRHPRFLHFCLASHLCKLNEIDRDQRDQLIEQKCKQLSWEPVIRLALSGMERRARQAATDLAWKIMRFGNPFAVELWVWLDRQNREMDQLARLARWLVHFHAPFHKAWERWFGLPELTKKDLETLDFLMQPAYRDSRFVYAVWRLLDYAEASLPQQVAAIRQRFLAECQTLHPSTREVRNRPVSNEEFARFDPFHSLHYPHPHEHGSNDGKAMPVTNVSWYQAFMYAMWAGHTLPAITDRSSKSRVEPRAPLEWCDAGDSQLAPVSNGSVRPKAFFDRHTTFRLRTRS